VCAPYFINLNNNTFKLKTILFLVPLHSQQKRTEKVISNYLFEVFRALVRSVEWSSVWGWFSWLCTRSPTASMFWTVRVVRGRPLTGARSMDPIVRNRFWKSSTPHLLHFLFGNSLINYFIPYFFDFQTFFMVALCNRADHYIFALLFLSIYLLFLSYFASPNLSGHRLDVYHTLTHAMALVRI